MDQDLQAHPRERRGSGSRPGGAVDRIPEGEVDNQWKELVLCRCNACLLGRQGGRWFSVRQRNNHNRNGVTADNRHPPERIYVRRPIQAPAARGAEEPELDPAGDVPGQPMDLNDADGQPADHDPDDMDLQAMNIEGAARNEDAEREEEEDDGPYREVPDAGAMGHEDYMAYIREQEEAEREQARRQAEADELDAWEDYQDDEDDEGRQDAEEDEEALELDEDEDEDDGQCSMSVDVGQSMNQC